MAEENVLRSAGWLRLARELDPFRATWRLFTSVRWAIGIITFLVLATLIGVIVPQVPLDIRGEPVAETEWLALQEERFGVFTDAMNRAGLFNVFQARWFIYALGLLVVSVAVCTVSRFPSIWRAVTRPRKRVSDAYFQSARHRFAYATPQSGPGLEAVLRRKRYKVERYQEGDTEYLFADRFQFVQLATFVSHLALIVLLSAGLVSRFGGFTNGMMLAEGASGPVFPLTHPDQMQVQLLDAVGRFTPDGRPLEYRSELAIYQGGETVKRCSSTVNSPCSYNGYRFHQVAYFGFGADVQVRDMGTGNVIYRETLRLADTLPSPHVIVRDGSGNVLLDEALVLTDPLATDDFTYYGRAVTLDNGRVLAIGALGAVGDEDWQLAVFETGSEGEAAQAVLSRGESAVSGGLGITFADLRGVPAFFVPDFPLPPQVAASGQTSGSASGEGSVLVQMSNVVYGSGETSAGTVVTAASGSGTPHLALIGLTPTAVILEPGQSAEIGGYEYTFVGQREFSGIEIRKDRSDYLVWIGSGMLIGGVLATFWVPRRRLWAKITASRTYLAGQAGHLVDLSKEMSDMARQAGAEPEEGGAEGHRD